VTKSGSRYHPLACPYCGLASAVPTKHATAQECIVALEREVIHLREYLGHGQSVAAGVSELMREGHRDGARSLRLGLTSSRHSTGGMVASETTFRIAAASDRRRPA
jgi:hypothetical protein